jgi:outer membrane protein
MTRKTLLTPTVLVAGLLFLGTIGLVAAHAAPPRPAGGAPVARILMIDMRRVIGESKVGQDIQRQVEALRRQASGDLKGEGTALQSEKTKLERSRKRSSNAVR